MQGNLSKPKFSVCPTNIYVAASLLAQGEAARVSLVLSRRGFHVTSSWIENDFSGKPSQDENFSAWEQYEMKWGATDTSDVLRADTLFLIADKPSSSGGYCCELGLAIAAHKNVVLVGKRWNVFFFHESINHVLSVPGGIELLTEVRNMWPKEYGC